MTHEQTAVTLAVIKAAYGSRFEMTDQSVQVWAQMLEDLSAEEAAAAVRDHVANSPYPPKIADLRKAVAARTTAAIPSWEIAWEEVMSAIVSVGRYREPRFSHANVDTAVGCMGWQALCNAEETQIPTLRAQFRDAYTNIRTRAVEAANAGRLEAHQNAKRLGAPASVGDVLKLAKGEP